GSAILAGVTSHNLALTASISGSTLTATDGTHTVFTLSINESNGAWTFTQFEPLDHGNAGEDLKTLDLSGLIKTVDFDNDSVTLGTGQLTVTITDDNPHMGKIDECSGAKAEGVPLTGNI